MFSARRTSVQRALETTRMGIADGASGSSSQLRNGLWIIGGSTPPSSPQPCWRTVIGQGRAFCQDQISAEAPCANNLYRGVGKK